MKQKLTRSKKSDSASTKRRKFNEDKIIERGTKRAKCSNERTFSQILTENFSGLTDCFTNAEDDRDKFRAKFESVPVQSEESCLARDTDSAQVSAIELQRIREQATQDVLREANEWFKNSELAIKVNSIKSNKKFFDSDIDLEELRKSARELELSSTPNVKSDTTTSTVKPHRKTFSSAQESPFHLANESGQSPSLRIEGLSPRTMELGTRVLGQVTSITRKDIAISFANNLSGYVPFSEIPRSTIASTYLANGNKEGDGDNSNDTETPIVDLSRHFYLGQYLRAAIVNMKGHVRDKSNVPATSAKMKRHIELSISPNLVNAGLDAQDLVHMCFVQATVKSIEDHGLIMDLGIGDNTSKVQGFLAFSDLGTQISASSLSRGAILLCYVKSFNRIVHLSADLSSAWSPACTKAPKVRGPAKVNSVKSLLPGSAVEVTINYSGKTGFTGHVMNVASVSADVIHSGAFKHKNFDISARYKPGSKIWARIIYSSFSLAQPAKYGVSVLDNVLRFDPLIESRERYAISSFVHNATLTRVLPKLGAFIYLNNTNDDILKIGKNTGSPTMDDWGFVHISRLSDSKIEVLTENDPQFAVGTKHDARVIGYNPIDNLIILAMNESTLKQSYLCLGDIRVGSVVEVKVDRLVLKNGRVRGLVVWLTDGIKGFVDEIHLSDVKLHNPQQRFRENQTIKARVLQVDTVNRSVRLTLKKSLVGKRGENVCMFEDWKSIKQGDVSWATIIRFFDHGALVEFLNGLHGFLPLGEMSEAYITSPQQQFELGRAIKVHVLAIERDKEQTSGCLKKLIVSCRRFSKEGDTTMISSCNNEATSGQLNRTMKVSPAPLITQSYEEKLERISIGQLVKGRIIEKSVEAHHLVVKLDEQLNGIIYANHLNDGSDKSKIHQFNRLFVGQLLNEMVVTGKRQRQGTVILTMKPSLIKRAQANQLKRIVKPIRGKEESLCGLWGKAYVKSILPDGLLVRLNEIMRNAQFERVKLMGGTFYGKVPLTDISDDFGRVNLTKVSVNEMVRVYILKHYLSRSKSGKGECSTEDSKVRESSEERIESSYGKLILSMRESRVPQGKRQLNNSSVEIERNTGRLREKAFQTVDNSLGNTNLFPNQEKESKPDKPDEPEDLGLSDGLSSKIVDSEILSLDDFDVGSLLRGFIININDKKGIFVQIGAELVGHVCIGEISDGFLKQWMDPFTVGQLVRVRVLSKDKETNHIKLTMKSTKLLADSLSSVNGNNQSKLCTIKFEDIQAGHTVTGIINSIQDYGIFIKLSNTSDNLHGLCHKSEIVDDSLPSSWKSLFAVGDRVIAKVLDVDVTRRRIKLSLKASALGRSQDPVNEFNYMNTQSDNESQDPEASDHSDFESDTHSDQLPEVTSLAFGDPTSDKSKLGIDTVRSKSLALSTNTETPALAKLGFDWTGNIMEQETLLQHSKGVSVGKNEAINSLMSRNDRGDGIEADLERQLLARPNDADLWIKLMAYHIETFSDIVKARQIAKRALRTIHFRLDDAKLDVWTAVLNLELSYGKSPFSLSDSSLSIGYLDKTSEDEDVLEEPKSFLQLFNVACQSVNDIKSLYYRVLSVLSNLDRPSDAAILYKLMSKKPEFSRDPKYWTRYAAFLMNLNSDPAENSALVKSLLPRAIQSCAGSVISSKNLNRANLNVKSGKMSKHDHTTATVLTIQRRLILNFALLEFTSTTGDPERGRTMFEQLVETWPRRWDIWDCWLTVEKLMMKREDYAPHSVERVRTLYQRMCTSPPQPPMKKHRAVRIFKQWATWEDELHTLSAFQDAKSRVKRTEHVKNLAREYVTCIKSLSENNIAEDNDDTDNELSD